MTHPTLHGDSTYRSFLNDPNLARDDPKKALAFIIVKSPSS